MNAAEIDFPAIERNPHQTLFPNSRWLAALCGRDKRISHPHRCKNTYMGGCGWPNPGRLGKSPFGISTTKTDAVPPSCCRLCYVPCGSRNAKSERCRRELCGIRRRVGPPYLPRARVQCHLFLGPSWNMAEITPCLSTPHSISLPALLQSQSCLALDRLVRVALSRSALSPSVCLRLACLCLRLPFSSLKAAWPCVRLA